MNPLLAKLQPYPFERLRQLFAGVTPDPAHSPISLGIGEPRHAFGQLGRRPLPDCVSGLVGLFDDKADKRLWRLLAVPGTAAGTTKTSHDGASAGDAAARVFGLDRCYANFAERAGMRNVSNLAGRLVTVSMDEDDRV